MSYGLNEVERAVCAMPLLALVGLVAVGAYVARSRAAFLLGCAGALLGLVIPEPHVHRQCASFEAEFMVSLADQVARLLLYGSFGAAVGWGLGVCLTRFSRRRKLQFSLRTLLLTAVGLAVIVGLLRWLYLSS